MARLTFFLLGFLTAIIALRGEWAPAVLLHKQIWRLLSWLAANIAP